MISEVKKSKDVHGNKQIDSFTVSDLQNNYIKFKKISHDVYVGSISEIKNLQLPVLSILQCVGRLTKMVSPAIDARYNPQRPTEGIITIYNQCTAIITKGNLTINEDDALKEMISQERTMADKSNFISYFFKKYYIFDVGIIGKYNNGVFNLQTNLIATQYISYKLKAFMIFDKYYYLIIALLISTLIYIAEMYYSTNIFVIGYEKLKDYWWKSTTTPPPPLQSKKTFFG